MALLLYQLITGPIYFTTSRLPKTYTQLGRLGVCLAAITSIVNMPYNYSLRVALTVGVGIVLLTIINAVIIDFFAQLWGGMGQSLGLFTGLSTTLLALSIWAPLDIIKYHLPQLSIVIGIAQLMVMVFVLYWQYRLIRYLYGLTGIRSVIILFSPYLLVVWMFVTVFLVQIFLR